MTGFLDSPATDAEPFWRAVAGAALVPAGGDVYLRARVTDGPVRTGLALHVPGLPEAAREAVALGARVVRRDDLVVLRSPGDLEFSLVAWDGERARPPAVRWPGGQSSLVDQVCVDVPAARFEAEAVFWSALTGWARRRSDLPEFEFLERPAGLPLRILLQRTGSGASGMHLDLACDDVAAEVARHIELGARVVRVVPGDWTTLRDPAGREYCVTARSPGADFVGAA